MKTIKLNDIVSDLIDALNQHEPFSATDGSYNIAGFSHIGLQNEVSDTLVINARNIPVVVIVDNKTGIVYQVALYVLLPKLLEKQNG